MINNKEEIKEKELQKFIAENPWLINYNYENVPELSNLGQEYQIGDMKRIDLILRDRINKNPVIVEFKAVPFYRENIGQILEYRARVVSTLTNQNEGLYSIFKEYVSCPRMVLVVEQCDDFARIACGMSGVDLIEYKKISYDLNKPNSVKSIKNFTEAYKADPLPISMDRGDSIDKLVYEPIREYLKKQNIDKGWLEPRLSDAYYYNKYNSMFINRWLFSEEEDFVSFGIYEDILDAEIPVCISFFTTKKKFLMAFGNRYNEKYKETNKLVWNDNDAEGFLCKRYSRVDFFKDLKSIIVKELDRYFEIKKENRMPNDDSD